jgi:hypothetical protein
MILVTNILIFMEIGQFIYQNDENLSQNNINQYETSPD